MSYSSIILADSPRVYYHLDEVSGFPQDSSGNALHITSISAGVGYQQPGVPGIGGSGIRFHNASSELASRTDDNLLDLGDVFTLEAWIKRTATQGTNQAIMSKGTAAYYLRMDSTNKLNLLRDGTAQLVTSTTTITDTANYHHVVATKNGATMALYIDGVDVTGTPTNSTCVDTAIDFTIASSAGGEPGDLTVDELAVYATALSATQVLAHYNAATIPPVLVNNPVWPRIRFNG